MIALGPTPRKKIPWYGVIVDTDHFIGRAFIVCILTLACAAIVDMSDAEPPPMPPPIKSPALIPSHPLRLRDEHRDILESAGWLDYVTLNLDEVTYVDKFEALSDDGNEWTGRATLKSNGKRTATVTTKGRTAESICATLVHEANHHEAKRETGSWSSQGEAASACRYPRTSA